MAGAALAAPAPVLRAEASGRVAELALPDDGGFTYAYRQSVYDVTVVEEQRAVGGTLEIERVRSADPRAVEYFRWPGEPRVAGGEAIQDAPSDLRTDALAIDVTADARQTLAARGRTLVLLDRFGEGLVRVAPASVPRGYWLVLALR